MNKHALLKNKVIKIVSWNVNGLRAIYKKGFEDFIMQNEFDIMCLQEIKIQKEKILKEIKSPGGYFPYFSCALRPGYSGVLTYTKISPQNDGYGFGIKRFDDEGRVLWQEYKDFILFNTYMPNGGRDKKRLAYKMEFYYEFLDYLKSLLKAGKNIIVTGDINTAHKPIDLARPKQNENNTGFLPEEREWIDRLLDAGFLDTFRIFNSKPQNYTWWDYKTRARQRNVGWRIDYFFISKGLEKKIKQCSIMPDVMGSDHCPVYLEIIY